MNKCVTLALLVCLNLLQACTNISQSTKALTTSGNPAITNASTSVTSYTHVLKNVSVQAMTTDGAGAPPALEISLSTDTSKVSYQPLTGFCGLGATNPCVCELRWTEVNTANGGTNSYSRTKRVPVTSVQSGQVKCKIAQSGAGSWDEIADGTVIALNIVPVSPNSMGLHAQSVNFKKGTSVGAGGDFLDDTLTPFRNIHRYTCFTKRTTSYEILNQFIPTNVTSTDASGNSTTASYNVFLSSRFCTSASSATGGAQCANPRTGYSAQSYYRNFYIRSDKTGQINSTNNTFDCPTVAEAIRYSAGQAEPPGQAGQYWPLDTTFSLATNYSSDWSVGVRATSILYKAGEQNSVSENCTNEDTSKRLTDKGTVTKCMGYARKPKVDGTCGTLKDSNGRIRPLTRLRRYRVVYPPMFQANGETIKDPNDPGYGSPFADEVYVADRLVVDKNGVATGSMIYGPKPCNYSWFDHEGIVNRTGSTNFFSSVRGDPDGAATPGYVATSNYSYKYLGNSATRAWSVNPDGLYLPNLDHDGGVLNANSYASCSATIPIVEAPLGSPNSVRLLTTNAGRPDFITQGSRKLFLSELHIQPIDPWSPNYLEDTSFQACAPLPDAFLEPPLHFYKNDPSTDPNGTMAWCTEPYPTQNPYWYQLNKQVKPQSASGSVTANLVNWGAGANPTGTAPVKTYTSHLMGGASGLLDANNACTGTNANAICTMTNSITGCTNYLSLKATNTCDRTVSYDPNQAYFGFPLLAEDADIEKMLQTDLSHDKNFACVYSVNADPNKVGKKMPRSACCGMVNGSAVLGPLLSTSGASVGHLEPMTNTSDPSVRFCGSPVE